MKFIPNEFDLCTGIDLYQRGWSQQVKLAQKEPEGLSKGGNETMNAKGMHHTNQGERVNQVNNMHFTIG